jgi:hypothetical protein
MVARIIGDVHHRNDDGGTATTCRRDASVVAGATHRNDCRKFPRR